MRLQIQGNNDISKLGNSYICWGPFAENQWYSHERDSLYSADKV